VDIYNHRKTQPVIHYQKKFIFQNITLTDIVRIAYTAQLHDRENRKNADRKRYLKPAAIYEQREQLQLTKYYKPAKT